MQAFRFLAKRQRTNWGGDEIDTKRHARRCNEMIYGSVGSANTVLALRNMYITVTVLLEIDITVLAMRYIYITVTVLLEIDIIGTSS